MISIKTKQFKSQLSKKHFMKLNTNGTWKGIDKEGGGGFSRKGTRTWLVKCSSKYTSQTPIAGELLALREDLLITKEFNFDKLEVETDAQSLIYIFETSSFSPHPHHQLAVLISDVENLLNETSKIVFKQYPKGRKYGSSPPCCFFYEYGSWKTNSLHNSPNSQTSIRS